MIILSGASSVGKTTLANDWCEKHQDYHFIQEVARNVMRNKGITRADLESYLQDNKDNFLEFEHLIFKEQNDREVEFFVKDCSFIADRGPDPLAFIMLHIDLKTALVLADSPEAKLCLQRYRCEESVLVILCPLDEIEDDNVRMVPTRAEQLQYTKHLQHILDLLKVPYAYCNKKDRYDRVRWLEELINFHD